MLTNKPIIFLAATVGFLLQSVAFAQNTSVLNAQLAQTIANGCISHAESKSQGVAVAVVDTSGALVIFLRMDGNPPGVGAFAIDKAVAVANWRFSTAQMAVAVLQTPGFANAPDIVTVAGGVPIFSESSGKFLGAIGVSGGAPAEDAACAGVGIAAAGLSQSRN